MWIVFPGDTGKYGCFQRCLGKPGSHFNRISWWHHHNWWFLGCIRYLYTFLVYILCSYCKEIFAVNVKLILQRCAMRKMFHSTSFLREPHPWGREDLCAGHQRGWSGNSGSHCWGHQGSLHSCVSCSSIRDGQLWTLHVHRPSVGSCQGPQRSRWECCCLLN